MGLIRYHPIESSLEWEKSPLTELRSFDWISGTAEWEIPGERPLILTVQFQGELIVRLLDEFALSTETDHEDCEGLVPNHFAYWVEGDAFHENQSSMWLEDNHPTKHYRFITGFGCVDVIAANPPSFSINPS